MLTMLKEVTPWLTSMTQLPNQDLPQYPGGPQKGLKSGDYERGKERDLRFS